MVVTHDSNELEFKIHTIIENNQIHLTCKYGCEWKTLIVSFEEMENNIFLDEFGLSKSQDSGKSHENLADFHFSMQREGDKIKCKSVHGTHWDYLDFRCYDNLCTANINNNGVYLKPLE